MKRLTLLFLLCALAACGESVQPTEPATHDPSDPVFNSNGTSYNCATDQTQIPTSECDALAALYNATNGANWRNSASWLTSSPCSWFGVSCTGGRVQAVFLPGNNLTGLIPAELGNLTGLRYLDLYNNNLTGSIPPELGILTILTYLALDDNSLSGSIPSEVGDLTSLDVLHLQNNDLTGSIPAALGNLTALRYLDLYNNNLTGSIPPELGNLTGLRWLALGNNSLNGPIPPELGNLTRLEVLGLQNNTLIGSIPVELRNLTSLTYLDLYNNNLTGSIPPELGKLTSLTWLALGNNSLSGSIASELGNLTSLEVLGLQNNNLSGLVPIGVATVGANASNCSFVNNNLYVPDTPEYTALGSAICGLPFSRPEEVTQNVMDQVRDLVSDGTLNFGEGNSLTVKLDAVLKEMDKAKYRVAINVLYAFIKHVEGFSAAGKLDGEQGQWLIDQADILIAQCAARL